jgi:hypothetical protein
MILRGVGGLTVALFLGPTNELEMVMGGKSQKHN